MRPQATQIHPKYVHSLELGELLFLSDWCAMHRVQGQWEHFARWLWQALEAEKDRRDQPARRDTVLEVPWDAAFLADALVACHVLSRQAQTENLGKFIDELSGHVVCASSAVLAELTLVIK